MALPRYRFDAFVLSPRRRLLLRSGRAQPLIPRYFDLLQFLIEHRTEAVLKQHILDAVWGDVAVSEGALSQAVRTIRRALGDDSRDPRFLRTVSRHGYQFVYIDVIEEDDLPAPAPALLAGDVAVRASVAVPVPPSIDAYPALIDRIRAPARTPADQEEQRDAAERLHELGTAEALRRIGTASDSAFARALLRDTRWNTPCAGEVPFVDQPHRIRVAWQLARLRLARGARVAGARWARAAVGSGLAGGGGGALGGILLTIAPGSDAPAIVIPVLAVIGLACGAVAGAGVGAGLSFAERRCRCRRG